jgi:taspase (threonine aspartase 1)
VYGAGCWCVSADGLAICCSVSGTGEQVVRTAFARRLVESIQSSAARIDKDNHDDCSDDGMGIETVMQRELKAFLDSPLLAFYSERLVGFLLLIRNSRDGTVELWCGHTTETMAFGYADSGGVVGVKFFISRKPVGQRYTLTGRLLQCSL